MMKKVVILGASGFLGGWIYKLLAADPQFSVIGTRNSSDGEPFIKIDVCNQEDMQIIIEEKPDIVIWCLMAGNEEPILINKGLTSLIDSLPLETRIIYISSDAYGEGKGHYREEDTPTYIGAVNPLSGYANAKIDGEHLVKQRSSNHIVIRTGPIYGKDTQGQWDQRISTLIHTLAAEKEYKRTSNLYKTYSHVEDLAQAIKELIQIEYKGTIHLGPLSKESHYSFNMKMAKHLSLNERFVVSYQIPEEEARALSIPMDTSLNTEKCKSILESVFRECRI